MLAGRRVLEVACGTGYWTRLIAEHASSVTACDLSEEVLTLARARQADGRVTFARGDAFAPDEVPGAFDAAFAGFLVSHIRRAELERLLGGLIRRLEPGGRIVLVENRYVEGSNWPITRTDADGNTFQRRRLNDGSEHEVLKNFFSPDELRDVILAAGGRGPEVTELKHYWYASFQALG